MRPAREAGTPAAVRRRVHPVLACPDSPMKAIRIVLVLALVAVVAAVVFLRGDETATGPGGGSTTAPDIGTVGWSPFSDFAATDLRGEFTLEGRHHAWAVLPDGRVRLTIDGRSQEFASLDELRLTHRDVAQRIHEATTARAQQPPPNGQRMPDPEEARRERVRGTPVRDGALVSVAVPYRQGTKSRYRIDETEVGVDVETEGQQLVRWITEVVVEVVEGDGSGGARVHLTIDAFRFQTTLPPEGTPAEFDSRHPDRKLLENPDIARAVSPQMALLGQPIELRIGPAGAPVAIEGVESWARLYAEALDHMGARVAAEADDVPRPERELARWSELLFPPTGGGAMKAGERRDATFERHVFVGRWILSTAGRIEVTHDDPDAFRVEFRGTPQIGESGRGPQTPAAAGIAKMRVVSSADSSRGSWRFGREPGRLLSAEIEAAFRLDTSFFGPPGPGGAATYTPKYVQVRREVVVDLLED